MHFVALPNGDLVVDEDEPPDTLAPLAEAVEQTLEPPYRAEAVRQSEDVWAVAARRIAVASFRADGDELELVAADEGRTLDRRRRANLRQRPRAGANRPARRATATSSGPVRLDGVAWEIEADPL